MERVDQQSLGGVHMVIRCKIIERIQTIDSKRQRLAQELEDAEEGVTFWQEQLDDPAAHVTDAREAELERRLAKAEKDLARFKAGYQRRADGLQHLLNAAVIELATG